jgi:haloalkane dehalogenase
LKLNSTSGNRESRRGWMDLYPFKRSRFALGQDLSLNYVDDGNGRPVLMVHGNPTWSFYFHPLIAALRDRYRCVALDHVGCGLSDKPQTYRYCLDQHIENLATLVQQLDLRDVTLIAHDWGGAIGLGALLQMPERFSRIVLLNTAAFPPPYFPLRIRACRFPVLGAWAVRRLNLFARAALTMATELPGGLPRDVADGLLAPYDSWENRVAIDRFVADIPTRPDQPTWQRLESIESSLSQLTLPRLLIWGMKDWCFRPECLERFLQHWSDAEVLRLGDAGHYVLLDRPAEVIAAVSEFLSAE